jgi:hypothetical protein
MYGYLTTQAPLAVLVLAALLWLVLGAATAYELVSSKRDLDVDLRLVLAASAATVGVAVVASLLRSWISDYQPQGRYLLPAVVPLALALTGRPAVTGVGRLRRIVLSLHLALGWSMALLLPWVVPPPP